MAKVFDLESNGLLDEITTLHCLTIYDTVTKVYTRYNSQRNDLKEGLKVLAEADLLIGHNIKGYDIPAIQKLYPRFKPQGKVLDTLIVSRLIWVHIRDLDFDYARKHPEFPKNMIGRHSLQAWGHRLGLLKGDYSGGWESWNQEMDDYCEQDLAHRSKLVALSHA